jgi:hypothetical protein
VISVLNLRSCILLCFAFPYHPPQISRAASGAAYVLRSTFRTCIYHLRARA